MLQTYLLILALAVVNTFTFMLSIKTIQKIKERLVNQFAKTESH
jgi:hypothetical protein